MVKVPRNPKKVTQKNTRSRSSVPRLADGKLRQFEIAEKYPMDAMKALTEINIWRGKPISQQDKPATVPITANLGKRDRGSE